MTSRYKSGRTAGGQALPIKGEVVSKARSKAESFLAKTVCVSSLLLGAVFIAFIRRKAGMPIKAFREEFAQWHYELARG